MNLPNLLTTLRVVAIPFFMILLLTGHYYSSGVIFIAASFTDYLDGHIARKKNLITNFGKIMDPLADKLLVTAALLCLIQLGDVAAWMAFIILAREFAITGLRAVAAGEGIIIAAGWSGKIKTVTQMIAIIFILFKNWPFSLIGFPFADIMLWIAVIMTVYSGAEYIYKSKDLFMS